MSKCAAEIASSFLLRKKTRLLNVVSHFVAKRRFQKKSEIEISDFFWSLKVVAGMARQLSSSSFFAALKTRLLNAIFHFVAKSHYTE